MAISYEPVLVLLSIAVAIIGSLTPLVLTSGSHEGGHESWEASFSLANGGPIMGTTIWSMHFIAMMAVQFPVLINYNTCRNGPVDWHCGLRDGDRALRC